ncbi:winged helix-turn-helix domain-containing protein [Natrononativus amylolyticus]|uniref:winged helix-turn-helix domain-containing protein n=1 Tax=Natrononativus amylolyticus TaxID=2963434 RepID=UPI0020CF7474|nr:winged helix-turn-helix domain-containing protein [Natrononativus amylolyticus]
MGGKEPTLEETVGDAFDLLSDETRLRILEALTERLRAQPGEPALGFSDLRRAVGRRDSGNFNYHLQQLVGRYVVETDGGYRLSASGLNVVTAIIAGTYDRADEPLAGEVDDPCPLCGETLSASYEDSLLEVSCPNDHWFRNLLPRGAVADRQLSAVVRLMTLRTRRDLELSQEGVCPWCYGSLTWALEAADVRGETEVRTRCGRCGAFVEIPFGTVCLHHPAVVSFYHDHAIDVRTEPYWSPVFWDPIEVVVECDDPLRIGISHRQGDDELELVVDGALSVVTIERNAGGEGTG